MHLPDRWWWLLWRVAVWGERQADHWRLEIRDNHYNPPVLRHWINWRLWLGRIFFDWPCHWDCKTSGCLRSSLEVKLDDAKTIHTFLHLIVNTNCSYLNSQMKMRPAHNSANTKPIFTIPEAQSFGGMTPGHICKVWRRLNKHCTYCGPVFERWLRWWSFQNFTLLDRIFLLNRIFVNHWFCDCFFLCKKLSKSILRFFQKISEFFVERRTFFSIMDPRNFRKNLKLKVFHCRVISRVYCSMLSSSPLSKFCKTCADAQNLEFFPSSRPRFAKLGYLVLQNELFRT